MENGIDNVFRADLGGDIHINNPSEELNLFFPELPGMYSSIQLFNYLCIFYLLLYKYYYFLWFVK